MIKKSPTSHDDPTIICSTCKLAQQRNVTFFTSVCRSLLEKPSNYTNYNKDTCMRMSLCVLFFYDNAYWTCSSFFTFVYVLSNKNGHPLSVHVDLHILAFLLLNKNFISEISNTKNIYTIKQVAIPCLYFWVVFYLHNCYYSFKLTR